MHSAKNLTKVFSLIPCAFESVIKFIVLILLLYIFFYMFVNFIKIDSFEILLKYFISLISEGLD